MTHFSQMTKARLRAEITGSGCRGWVSSWSRVWTRICLTAELNPELLQDPVLHKCAWTLTIHPFPPPPPPPSWGATCVRWSQLFLLCPFHLHRTIWGHQVGCDPTEGTDPNKAGDFPGLQVADISNVSYMRRGGMLPPLLEKPGIYFIFK